MTLYKVWKDGKHIGDVILGHKVISGRNKEVLRPNSTVISGDKHNCRDETKPDDNEQVHLKNFGRENQTELKGHAKFEKGKKRFFHKEPLQQKSEVISQDDWEATDAGGPPFPPPKT